MGAPVFISYSRSDHPRAIELANALRDAGFAPWLDVTSIPASLPWFDEITKAVRRAELVLVIDSPAWQASSNCAKEHALAVQLAKSVVVLDPSQPQAWLDQVRQAHSRLPEEEAVRAKLLGDSYTWHMAGRHRAHLATGRVLLRFRQVARTGPGVDELARHYLVRGSRAALIRTVLAATAMLVTLSLFIGWRTALEVQDRLVAAADERTAELAVTWAVNNRLAQNPYAALKEAITAAQRDGDNYTTASALATVLNVQLPVAVHNPAGEAPRPARALPSGPMVGPGGLGAELRADGSLTLNGGEGNTTFRPAGSVTALAWSPDGRRLAVADAAGISVVRLPEGAVVGVLRGLDGAVDAVRWEGPTRVLGSAGQTVATWQLPGTMIAETSSWFMSLASSADGSRALAVGREGTFTLIEGRRVVGPNTIPGLSIGLQAIWIDNGWAVLGAGPNDEAIVALVGSDGSVGAQWPQPGCDAWSIAPAEGSEVILACPFEFGVRVLDTRTGTTRDIAADSQPVSAILDLDGSILTGSHYSEIVRLVGGEQPQLTRPWSSICYGGANLMTPSHDRSHILVGGLGKAGCATIFTDPESRAEANFVVPRGEDFHWLRAASWTKHDQVLATGWASGHVWFVGTDFAPRVTMLPSGSEIRGVAFNADDTELIVVTRDGEVIALPTELPLASFDRRTEIAEQRLRIGVDAGLL